MRGMESALRFGPLVIDAASRSASVGGRPVPLGARAFDLLLALAERRDRLVGRDELLSLVWPGLVVEEHNITAQISTLRKLLGPQVIATVPGRGYRFVAAGDASGEAPPALPAVHTRFIGRIDALADVQRLLARTRLVTLTGIGGSGKTRLAIECARRLAADGACALRFVDLAPLDAPERVAHACASAFGLGEVADGALIERLAAQLAARPTLIVLDNCEHLREAAAAFVDALLARAAPATRVLATSREPLALDGEQIYPLHPLALPASNTRDDVRAAEAAQLFADRARLAWPAFEIDAGNAAAVADICRRLDGIALAIELAAARVPLLSPPEIAARLDDRFRLLVRPAGTGPARQQALATTLQWSYDQLAPPEQRLLRLLAVCAGGCTLATATALADDGDEYGTLALLSALYGKSLLTVAQAADADGHPQPRYGMLDTVRAYARERLDAAGETAAACTRHAAHFLALAEAAAPYLDGPQQSRWMQRLGAEHQNLAAALSRCADAALGIDATWGLRLAAASSRYWLFNEVELGCRLLAATLQRDDAGAADAARLKVLCGLAAMHMHRGLGEAGLPYARSALALAGRARDAGWQAKAHGAIGVCLSRDDEEAPARAHYLMARDLAQASGDAATLAAAVNNLATLDFRRGEHASAERGFRQALHLARAQGNVRSALIFLHNLVRILVASGDERGARDCALEAERLLRDVGEDVLKLELLEVSAGIASMRGEHEVAARWWGCACQRFVDEGYRRPPEDELQMARLMTMSRAALGDAAFDRIEAGGRALPPEALIGELRAWLQEGGAQQRRAIPRGRRGEARPTS
jgi:predicted ATPase/DNA-binding winged helix-turn-helix (wHTH) protein